MAAVHILQPRRTPAGVGMVPVLAAIITAGWTPSAFAQPGLTATLGLGLSSLSALPADVTDGRHMAAVSVGAEHLWATRRLRLFYGLDAGTFATAGDWHYYLHTAGATYRLPLGAATDNALFLTASGGWRMNGTSWSAADFRALGVKANVELHPRESATVQFGYRLDRRAFSDLPELDQLEQSGFASVLGNLPSRTSLVGEAYVGGKSYDAAVYSSSTISAPSSWAAHGATGGRGRGMGPGLRGSSTPLLQGDRAGQVTWIGRVAQSLTARTGAFAQIARRTTFGRVPPVVVTTPALFFDDGVYDDPYGADARTVRAHAKHLSAGGMSLDGDASVMRKHYNSAVAIDLTGVSLPGGPLREDRVTRASAMWSMPVFVRKTGSIDVTLHVDYSFVRHRSNDAFYNYTSHTLGFGTSIIY